MEGRTHLVQLSFSGRWERVGPGEYRLVTSDGTAGPHVLGTELEIRAIEVTRGSWAPRPVNRALNPTFDALLVLCGTAQPDLTQVGEETYLIFAVPKRKDG